MQGTEIHYKIPWRSRGNFPGHHASQQRGAGQHFLNHVSLIDAPDPRRFDVRASLRDPFEQIQVRVYQQTSSIPVVAIVDLSASMQFEGEYSKAAVMADFVDCLSFSAYRTGDSFGFIGCGDAEEPEMLLPPTLNRAAGAAMATSLRAVTMNGRNSDALLRAADYVGSKRALVFLISDFHYPIEMLEQILGGLAYHDVVPVMLWDRSEYERLPRFGLARVVDQETGRSRVLFMRDSLRTRIRARFDSRKQALFNLFASNGREPLLLQNGFNADEVSRYFLG